MQEKRIYDLKKKNQELEKFKFVLDYKIKELRRQMEPRENEIKSTKEQIGKVTGMNDYILFIMGSIAMVTNHTSIVLIGLGNYIHLSYFNN